MKFIDKVIYNLAKGLSLTNKKPVNIEDYKEQDSNKSFIIKQYEVVLIFQNRVIAAYGLAHNYSLISNIMYDDIPEEEFEIIAKNIKQIQLNPTNDKISKAACQIIDSIKLDPMDIINIDEIQNNELKLTISKKLYKLKCPKEILNAIYIN